MLNHPMGESTSASHLHQIIFSSHICAMSSVWLSLPSCKGVEFLVSLEDTEEHLRLFWPASSHLDHCLEQHTWMTCIWDNSLRPHTLSLNKAHPFSQACICS